MLCWFSGFFSDCPDSRAVHESVSACSVRLFDDVRQSSENTFQSVRLTQQSAFILPLLSASSILIAVAFSIAYPVARGLFDLGERCSGNRIKLSEGNDRSMFTKPTNFEPTPPLFRSARGLLALHGYSDAECACLIANREAAAPTLFECLQDKAFFHLCTEVCQSEEFSNTERREACSYHRYLFDRDASGFHFPVCFHSPFVENSTAIHTDVLSFPDPKKDYLLRLQDQSTPWFE